MKLMLWLTPLMIAGTLFGAEQPPNLNARSKGNAQGEATNRVEVLKERREVLQQKRKAREAAAKALPRKSRIHNPAVAKFDKNLNGFIDPAKHQAYRADVERRKAEGAQEQK